MPLIPSSHPRAGLSFSGKTIFASNTPFTQWVNENTPYFIDKPRPTSILPHPPRFAPM